MKVIVHAFLGALKPETYPYTCTKLVSVKEPASSQKAFPRDLQGQAATNMSTCPDSVFPDVLNAESHDAVPFNMWSKFLKVKQKKALHIRDDKLTLKKM